MVNVKLTIWGPKMRSLISIATACAASFSMAQAASLNFNELSNGFLGESEAALSNASIKGAQNASDLLILNDPDGPGGFCFVQTTFCNADGEILFNEGVTDLTFRVSNWRSGDRGQVTVFDGSGTQLVQRQLIDNETVDLTALTDVHRLVFVDNSVSTQPGVVFRDFFFEPSVTGDPVPLPAGAALMATGALALFRRRKVA